jgi:hypothetical protein
MKIMEFRIFCRIGVPFFSLNLTPNVKIFYRGKNIAVFGK